MKRLSAFNEFVEMERFPEFIRVSYKNNIHVDLAAAQSIVALRLKETDYLPHKLLINIPLKINIDKTARDYLSGKEGLQNIMATAMVVSSKYSYFILNFFMKLNPPKVPVKIFYNELKAIEWLKQIV